MMGVTQSSQVVRSPAKVNWTLRVLGPRPDGFHELESLVSAVSLHDDLCFSSRPEGAAIACDDPAVPTGSDNLIARAAAALARASGVSRGFSCRVTKRIPLGGGLGGGSSNAAATLRALNEAWELHWPVERLVPVAASVGSDVPFFLYGGSAMMRGRGERIEPVHAPFDGWIVLLLPGLHVATPAVYAECRRMYFSGYGTPPGVESLDAAGVCEIRDAARRMEQTFNMLEEPAMRVCPPLRTLLDEAARLAGRPVRLSGSGSSLFTAFNERPQADDFARRAEAALGIRTCVVQQES